MNFASKMLIGGELVASESGALLDAENPATGEVVGKVPAGSAQDIERAVAAAKACFESGAWTKRAAHERAAAMWKLSNALEANIDSFAELDVIDNGMPMLFARGSINSAINGLRYYAGMCTKLYGKSTNIVAAGREFLTYTQPEPVGVVGAITPWNAPLATLVNKIAPAIAAGCPIVVKPAEQTSLSSLKFGELLTSSDLPPGLINIVTGLGADAGAALAQHPDVDKLTFTGSTVVGRSLVHAAAENFKRLTLELGGKSPVFVFDDADLERTIPQVAMAIFANSGQVCFAGSRLYVQRKLFPQLIERVAAFAKTMRLGDGLDPQTQLGPVVSRKQMDRVLGYIERGIAEGAELLCGGKQHGERGYFVEPTVFANPEGSDITIAREEIFGPVLTAMPFEDLDEVAQLANASPYGLGSGVFTTNVTTAHAAARKIRSGNVWVNCYGILDKAVPFGGFKQSGWGREHGFEGIEAFLETKSVFTPLS